MQRAAEDCGLPANYEAERAVLGSVLQEPAQWGETSGLAPEDFGLDSHRRIYARMAELREENTAIDLITLTDALRRNKELEAVGGAAYLCSLTEGTTGRASIAPYIRILAEKRRLREIIQAAEATLAAALDQVDSSLEIIQGLQAKAASIMADVPEVNKPIFVPASTFINQAKEEIEWRVRKVIEIGTSGVVIGLPKSGKSPVVTEMAVALSTGTPWLECEVTRCKVGLVSREDYPGTTARRVKRLLQGRGVELSTLFREEWLWVNTRAQSKELRLDKPLELAGLIRNVKQRGIEFLILDVLNVIHDKDENDPTEMRAVMKNVEAIRDETGSQVCIVHHSRKNVDDAAPLVEEARGASSIAGFAEFMIGVREIDEETHTRRVRFLCKSGEAHWPFYWHIRDLQTSGGMVIERTDWTPPSKSDGRSRVQKALKR